MAMKVAVYLADQNPHRDRTIGVTNFTRCLLFGLSLRPDIHLSTVVSASSYSFSAPDVQEKRLPWATDNHILRLVTDNLSPIFMESGEPQLIYYPKGYVSHLMRPHGPLVGTIHDTILQFYADHYAHYRSGMDLAYWIGLMKSSIRKFDMILAVSNTTRDQIHQFCERYKISPPPIQVTYEASDYEDIEIRQKDKEDYVIHLASLAPHKNTKLLLELWASMAQEKGWPPLKLIGPKKAVADFLGCPGISHIPSLDNDKLSDVIQGARALLLPSAIEGFGLPALEGYYHGTPVCFVRRTSVDEILSPFTSKGGFLLDDPSSFKKAVDEILGMSFDEIVQIRDGLKAKFSKNNFVEATACAFGSIV